MIHVLSALYPSVYFDPYLDDGGHIHFARRWWTKGVAYVVPTVWVVNRAEKARIDWRESFIPDVNWGNCA